MDVHSMAADLDRRFGGQNVSPFGGFGPAHPAPASRAKRALVRFLAEGLSDEPDMTGVFDLSRNPSPCRGVGVGTEAAYRDMDKRSGEALRWEVSAPDEVLARFERFLVRHSVPPLQEKDIERRDGRLFISTQRLSLFDLRSYARQRECDLVARLEGVT
jgi:hypothetical protein